MSVSVWPCWRSFVRGESNANSIPVRWLDYNISIKRWLEPIKRAQRIWLNLVTCSHSCDAHHWPNSIFRRRFDTRKRGIGAACWRNGFLCRFSGTSNIFRFFLFISIGFWSANRIALRLKRIQRPHHGLGSRRTQALIPHPLKPKRSFH